MVKSNKGMTLIEVLIASILLFIAITSLTYVMRSYFLFESRLDRNLVRAKVVELALDEIQYQYQYLSKNKGELVVDGMVFNWGVEVLEKKKAQRVISDENGQSSEVGEIVLYEATVYDALDEYEVAKFKDVFWQF
ncbi:MULTISPECIES: prepilin-type N-terminal cleavage/methylation domain-containing protein [Pseudoalteromonas]|uniref:prepilin-type N-terminal cleavage/methylation domain-containing protein n=1 Tax=Pseudoalteromonas TaxID=53246 RepID=UPI000299E572|nr:MULTISPECIES: prepilin-type N-terminal cleavage/methylation domain-containing protein [Pseudoalteromonas]MCG7551813.1 prepilin-type N-terminal cleavage/methylation domain-containing protein [Pseudoalteromonas sp. Of11M-6]